MIVIGYFSISLIVFVVWFIVFWKDTSTSKKDLLSWVALLLGPLVWPVVLPLSFLQIISRKSVVQATKSEQKS
jgi:polyferredoxin